MIQAVLLFLIVIALLGVGGKWLRRPPPRRRDPSIEAAMRCTVCRAYVVGKTPAACDRANCPFR